jgi:voltage-gated potassium channel
MNAAVDVKPRMTEERWEAMTFWPLLVGSFAFLISYSWRVISNLEDVGETVALGIMAVIWVLFAVDYVVRLILATPRRVWFRRHIFALLIVLMPALMPLRLLRVVTTTPLLQRNKGTAIRSRIGIYGAGAAVVLIWMAALGVLDAERASPDANIQTFGEAIWWAFVTITTVGYGDYYPVTTAGRMVAVLLMAGGVAVLSVVTATLSSWIIDRAAARTTGDADQPATRGQVRELATMITQWGSQGPQSPTR